MVVNNTWALVVDTLGISGDNLTTYVTDNLQHTAVRVHSILHILWGVVEGRRIGEVALLKLDDSLHQRMREVIL